MQNLKDLMRESIGVDNWSTGSTWDTRHKDENEFKKLALGLCGRDFDKVKDSIQKFVDEILRDDGVTQVSRRPGYSPKGKFAIGVCIQEDGITINLKFNRRVLIVSHLRRACEKGAVPFSDWAHRGSAIDIWADCQSILSIDENSPIVVEMEEFAYHSRILSHWII